ncbi:hypothetical protein ACFQVC_06460 [Streptomyces monticola]|uniref:DUF1963 domain-containing protein n=1 Tax=Streptomyces monticola TaxID=2666263 RepID=A0ABW2JER6_9ACTN
MPRRIPEPPFELADLIPEFAELARETTLLYPRSGDPDVRESSIGGPLLWPAAESWPYCGQVGHWAPGPGLVAGGVITPGVVPMVPVVQLYARDVPRLVFPEGKDVLQLVWCPLLHPEDPAGAALPRLYWRTEAEVDAVEVLRDVPESGEDECDEDLMPRPCTVCPTPAVDYPKRDLPRELELALGPRLREIENRFGCHYSDVASALQNKVGGYPAWAKAPNWPHCSRGHRMEHLLSITGEPRSGRWLPLDEHHPHSTEPLWRSPADPAVMDSLGPDMHLGDEGGIYLFLCRACPELPYAHRFDCY